MGSYTVSRSTVIAAPATTVKTLVDDFRHWQVWSPWEASDSDLRRTYSGAEAGVGARYFWEGSRKVGSGSMEIVVCTEASTEIRLEFLKPWRAAHEVAFTFTLHAPGTRVTWTMSGTHTGLAKVFGRFVNVDKLVGRDFEKGLAKLKAAAEAAAAS